MERKQTGGCCLVPRYGVGGQGQHPQAGAGMSWRMGRIMLKFRPIAPKPAAMAPAPTPAPVAAAAGAGRGKRKAVGGGRRGRKPKKAATTVPPPVVTTAAHAAPAPAAVQVVVPGPGEKESEKEKSLSSRSSSSSAMTSVDSAPPSPPPPAPRPPPATTLPLMPVSPTAADQEKAVETPRTAGAQPAVVPPAATPTPSCWVTVEDVTSTWRDGEAPSSAAIAAASASACATDGGHAPAFVSDQWGRVTWANAAFARAVSDDAGDNTPVVGLAGALPAWGTCAGFTCRVRLSHAAGVAARSVVAPCDVWRLDAAGCYLWRLDLQAALTLGGGLP